MTTFRDRLAWLLVGSSLGLHFVTVACFTRQPERLAAFTVMPIWVWGGLGLLLSAAAYCLFRARLSLIVTAIWSVTLLIGADEARVLGNLGKSAPLPGPASPDHGRAALRVVTLNCGTFSLGDPANELAAWQPDLVLLQEAHPHQVRHIADTLFNGRGDYRCHQTSGIVTRWRIDREIRTTTLRDQQATILLPNGNRIEVVNLHLATAATDLRLWRPETWRTHRANRASRRLELAVVLQILEQNTSLPTTPTLIGGDFNAPATDPVLRLLARDFTDAFGAAGTGWGNTFQRGIPIFRSDQIHANRHFTPIRCRAITTPHSNHRMVVADFLTDALGG
jgi:endonuclease/exonuclease/phosphatase (EEP) superfamily protein YafD